MNEAGAVRAPAYLEVGDAWTNLSAGFGVVSVVFALASSCSPAPPPTTDFDIKLVDDSTQSIAFGRNILSTDKEFLVTESALGLTPFVSLDPPLEFTPSGITAHFKSSFAHTDVIPGLSDTQCPWAKSGSNCSFPSDAELQLFTRDPNELRDTLLTDDGWNYDFFFDSSTQRSYPTGEAVGFLNPTPYAVPAAVVMDVDGPPADTVSVSSKRVSPNT